MALFPVSIAVGILLWFLDTDLSVVSYFTIGTLVVTTLVLRVFSNAVQLIRVRSWAVSSLFIVLMALYAHLYSWDLHTMIATQLFLIYNIGMLSSYQSHKPQVSTFIATVALSLLTMYMPWLFVMVPISLLCSLTTLRTFSMRTLLAIVFGLLLPYEIFFSYYVYNDTLNVAFQYFVSTFHDFYIPFYSSGTSIQTFINNFSLSRTDLCLVHICVFGIIGIIHFLHTSFNDKIRTRMHYITIIIQWVVLLLLLFFTQGHSLLLVSMLTLCSSILLAHYFVFSKGLVANLIFWLFILSCFYLALPVF